MISVFIKSLILSMMLVLPGLSGRPYMKPLVKPEISRVPELTLENVYREILYQNIKFPEVVMRQVVWETQWLKCRNCTLNLNNLFGFTTKRGLMKFDTWVESVKYYAWWQKKLNVEKYTDYYEFLVKVRYARGASYNKSLKSLNIDFITEKFQRAIPDSSGKF